MIDRARANEKVEFVTPAIVDEILAPQGHVEGVRIRNPQTKELGTIPLDGVFVAIGHDPNTMVFKGKLEMDSNGYLRSEEHTSELQSLRHLVCRLLLEKK